ncbi:pectin lyase-like superfamily protein [Striga asiatica]|uniref:Pectin lyase-like superfamily protein n=1 Tax=Striga asiatica TaxID=4170 RepID=A0A5A7PPW2_STRAF|nr:pectin lyase-like superfamily protein [Striga asiatica]
MTISRGGRHATNNAQASSSCLITVLCASILFTINGVRCDPVHTHRGLIGEAVFDVTKFGAKADGRTDNAMSIIRAWQAACRSVGPAKVLIPRGQFVASEIIFAGPCVARKPIVIEIQGNVLAYDDLSSYSSGAWIMVQKVDGILITGGGTINGRGREAWQYNSQGGPLLPVSMVFQTVQNGQINFLNFVDSMGFHLKVTDSTNIIVSNLKIQAPAASPNTDGIHLSSNINVKVTDIYIGTGDDCVSVGHGNQNILIARVTCGPGHGLSVGSLGKRPDETNLKGVTIINCTVNGATNGARIKTYRASPQLSASTIYFDNIVMNGVANPIIIDQNYASKKKRQASNVRLSDIHFRNIRGTTTSPVAVSLNCSSTYPCTGVELSNIDLRPAGRMGPVRTACSNAKFFVKGRINPGPAMCT